MSKKTNNERLQEEGSRMDDLSFLVAMNNPFLSHEEKNSIRNGYEHKPQPPEPPKAHSETRTNASTDSDTSSSSADDSPSYSDYSESDSNATYGGSIATLPKSGMSGFAKFLIWAGVGLVAFLLLRAWWNAYYDISTFSEGSNKLTVPSSKYSWKWIILPKNSTSYQISWTGDGPKQTRWIKLTSPNNVLFTLTDASNNEPIRTGYPETSMNGRILENRFPPGINQIQIFCSAGDTVYAHVIPPQIPCYVKATGPYDRIDEVGFLGVSTITIKAHK